MEQLKPTAPENPIDVGSLEQEYECVGITMGSFTLTKKKAGVFMNAIDTTLSDLKAAMAEQGALTQEDIDNIACASNDIAFLINQDDVNFLFAKEDDYNALVEEKKQLFEQPSPDTRALELLERKAEEAQREMELVELISDVVDEDEHIIARTAAFKEKQAKLAGITADKTDRLIGESRRIRLERWRKFFEIYKKLFE